MLNTLVPLRPLASQRRLDEQLRHFGNGKSRLVLHIEKDPVTGIETFALYTDDGEGNGVGILQVALADIMALGDPFEATFKP